MHLGLVCLSLVVLAAVVVKSSKPPEESVDGAPAIATSDFNIQQLLDDPKLHTPELKDAAVKILTTRTYDLTSSSTKAEQFGKHFIAAVDFLVKSLQEKCPPNFDIKTMLKFSVEEVGELHKHMDEMNIQADIDACNGEHKAHKLLKKRKHVEKVEEKVVEKEGEKEGEGKLEGEKAKDQEPPTSHTTTEHHHHHHHYIRNILKLINPAKVPFMASILEAYIRLAFYPDKCYNTDEEDTNLINRISDFFNVQLEPAVTEEIKKHLKELTKQMNICYVEHGTTIPGVEPYSGEKGKGEDDAVGKP